MNTNNTEICKSGNAIFLKYPIFNDVDFLIHGASTRAGGVSTSPHFSSMNLGLSTDDDIELIKKNWSIFCNLIGVDINNTVCASQLHNDNIRIVNSSDKGKGIIKRRDYEDVDGLITNENNIALCIFSADCVPIMFADTKERAIGAAHCGWKGTYKDLAAKMVQKMNLIYGSKPENIRVSIGAAIKKCCYIVSEELYSNFYDKYHFSHDCFDASDKCFRIDLPEINKNILKNSGIPEKNIFVSDVCTCCNKDELFSHRGSNGKRGLMVNCIQII